jgi:UDP-N-acetylglucosamine 2-epimerase (hydrolysing)
MKKILFLTGTRADFGKIKSLIQTVENSSGFEAFVFVTGMHLQKQYGYTLIEVERCGFKNIFQFENHTDETTMDLTLAKTIQGLSQYISKVKPDMIVVHGDRVEALAGAIVGSLNNILVAHIEGGEISGTIDELLRHATSKMAHIHFVANNEAKKRLLQMGEIDDSVFVIGSPDIDIMFSNSLPNLIEAKKYYQIDFEKYAIAMFHPVTTEYQAMQEYAHNFVQALLKDTNNYVVVFPNNDLGSKIILNEYQKLSENPKFRIFPSLRFEYFLTLLKNAKFIIGNSSAGIREAPYYKIPTINIGTRQNNRTNNSEIINTTYNTTAITHALTEIEKTQLEERDLDFGTGNSTELFIEILKQNKIWELNHQKQFRDI